MKTKSMNAIIGALLLAGASFHFVAKLHAEPMGTAFTYQGRLYKDGSPVTGLYDLNFKIYDAAAAGTLITAPDGETLSAVPVDHGFFSVALDFGSGVFTGPARWLEIASREHDPEGLFETVSPRQELTPTPYAMYAEQAGLAEVASQADAVAPNGVTGPSIQNHTITGDKLADGQVVRSVNGLFDHVNLLAGSNVEIDSIGNDLIISSSAGSGPAWLLNGNSGTVAGTQFLGTIDAQPLELKAHNIRVLRLEGGSAPNLIGGSKDNLVSSNVVGATIGGGGYTFGSGIFSVDERNRITDNYGVIGGGAHNVAGNSNASIHDGRYATVGGGYYNAALGLQSTVGGGRGNAANGTNATISGGWVNKVAFADAATISGGENNYVGTNIVNLDEFGMVTNYAGYSAVGGGENNRISSFYATIGGGADHQIFGHFCTIGGGLDNQIEAATSPLGLYDGTIAGGSFNQLYAEAGAIGGGSDNIISQPARWSFIPGGTGAETRVPGQMAQACGKFSQNGDAQASTYVLLGTTTGTNVFTSLLAGTSKIVVPENTVMMFDIQLVGGIDSDKCHAKHIVGGIVRAGSGAPKMMLPSTHTDSDLWGFFAYPTWQASVVADSTANALDVRVAAHPGRWVATVRTTEVRLPHNLY